MKRTTTELRTTITQLKKQGHSNAQIVTHLNKAGYRTGTGGQLTKSNVSYYLYGKGAKVAAKAKAKAKTKTVGTATKRSWKNTSRTGQFSAIQAIMGLPISNSTKAKVITEVFS